MMSIILTILGGIAALILFLLAFVLAVTLLVVFVPVRYECAGSISGTSFTGQAKVSWLFGIVSVQLEEDQTLTLRIFGIRAWRGANTSTGTDTQDREEPPPAQADAGTAQREESAPQDRPAAQHREAEPESESGFADKIRGAWNMFKSVRDYPGRSEITGRCWLLVKQVLRSTLPKRLELRGTFGFEDPCYTGMAAGAIHAAAPFAPKAVKLLALPDFSRRVLELTLLVQGKLAAISLIVPMVRFLLSAPVWKLVKKIIRRRKSHGKQL